MAPELYIKNRGQRVAVNPAFSLLNNFLIQNIPIRTQCGGKAVCGLCRIKVLDGKAAMSPVREAEKKRLGEDLIRQGWRLACQSHILKDIVAEIPPVDSDQEG